MNANTGYNGIPRDEIPNSDWGVREDFQGQVTSKLRNTEGLVRNSVKGWRLEGRHWHPGELAFWMEQSERSQRPWGWRGSRARSQPLVAAWKLVMAQEGVVCAANESAHFIVETNETRNIHSLLSQPRAQGCWFSTQCPSFRPAFWLSILERLGSSFCELG